MIDPQKILELKHLGPETSELQAQGFKVYDVHKWSPPFCGDMDLRITAQGEWFHQGEKITRQPLIELFAGLLKKEGPDYFLVTPVEKLRIKVDDLPMIITEVRLDKERLSFLTQFQEPILWGPDHGLEFDGTAHAPRPRVHIRSDLWARFSRSAYYDLMDLFDYREDAEGVGLRFRHLPQGPWFRLKL